MNLFRNLAAAIVMLGFVAAASASPADPKNGTEYLTLPSAQPTDTGKKVEVIEFFAFYCPHCYAFDPSLAAWVKKQGDNIVFKRVHVPRDASVLPQQRLYYALEALGLEEQFHSKVFDAMHVQHNRLSTDEMVYDWAAKNGIDRAKFMDAYKSFGVQARVRRANSMMEAYRVNYWPMIVIDGKYVTSPSQAAEGAQNQDLSETQQQQMSLQVMDWLVAKAKAEKK